MTWYDLFRLHLSPYIALICVQVRPCQQDVANPVRALFTNSVKVKNLTGKPVLLITRREGLDPIQRQGSGGLAVSPPGASVGGSGSVQWRDRAVSDGDYTAVSFLIVSL